MKHFYADILTPVQRDGLLAVGILVIAALLALAIQRGLFGFLRRLAAKRSEGVFAAVLHRAAAPSRFIFPLVAVEAALPNVSLPMWLKDPGERVAALCIIAAIAWVIVAVLELFADLAKLRYRLDEPDNLRARQVETRLDILNRSLISIVLLLAVAAMLMTFPPIRTIGATLLASAGVAGIAVGFAARPFLENLVAGVQIALTQPIRIDDVVIVEKEYGRIEKITATYVVVRLWDLRRMILPLTYFIDHPFENWTYSTANLIGSVMIYLDYTMPIAAIREETDRILKDAPLWDGKVVNVAMTDAKEATVEVRILVSARNSPDLFDLRCLVREKLVTFVHEHHPNAMPSTRVVFAPERDSTAKTTAGGSKKAVPLPARVPTAGSNGNGKGRAGAH